MIFAEISPLHDAEGNQILPFHRSHFGSGEPSQKTLGGSLGLEGTIR
jgi:hypothetical protein